MAFKKILNTGERAIYEITKEVAEKNEIEVFVKMRIADVIEIDRSGICNEEYSYALKAHFDVLVARASVPLMAIEFDGGGHDPKFDHLKNALCERFGLPMVRVTLEHVNSRNFKDTAVHFLLYQLLCLEAFNEQVNDPYEVYDPMFMLTVAGKHASFPFAYANRWRNRLAKRFKENLDRIGEDAKIAYEYGNLGFRAREGAWVKDGRFKALCAQDVGDGRAVLGAAELGFVVFGMDEKWRHDFMALQTFVIGLAAAEMYENGVKFLAGDDGKAMALSEIEALPARWVKEGYMLKVAANISSGHE